MTSRTPVRHGLTTAALALSWVITTSHRDNRLSGGSDPDDDPVLRAPLPGGTARTNVD